MNDARLKEAIARFNQALTALRDAVDAAGSVRPSAAPEAAPAPPEPKETAGPPKAAGPPKKAAPPAKSQSGGASQAQRINLTGRDVVNSPENAARRAALKKRG